MNFPLVAQIWSPPLPFPYHEDDLLLERLVGVMAFHPTKPQSTSRVRMSHCGFCSFGEYITEGGVLTVQFHV